MATTTNFSWATPDDTANVKDGAAAIRSLGTAIDTTVATMVPKTVVDAKGDLIAATAADTVDRLAVGANDTVLTADSSTATGLKWATPAGGGSMTLITSGTITSNSAVNISSLPQTYKHLYVTLNKVYDGSNSAIKFRLNSNGDMVYNYSKIQYGATAANFFNDSGVQFTDTISSSSSSRFTAVIMIYNYTTTDTYKLYHSQATFQSSVIHPQVVWGTYAPPSGALAISTFSIVLQGSNPAGGTYQVYGVN